MYLQHELIIPNEGLPFKLFLFEGGQGNYIRESHWHTSVEIFAVMEGELVCYVNKEKFPLYAGELLLDNAYEIHSVHAPKKNKTAVIQIPLRQFEPYLRRSVLSVLRAACGETATGKIPRMSGW